LRRRTHAAKRFFQPRWTEKSEHAKLNRMDYKCVRLEFGQEDTLSRFDLEDFLSHVDIELSI